MGAERKTKKAAFQKKCAKQKESITKNALAEQAYQESKTKKMCMKTRVASELNNKRMVEYYDFGIKKLKANCNKADAMYTADRNKFVDGVCQTIRNDIKGAVSSWMSPTTRLTSVFRKRPSLEPRHQRQQRRPRRRRKWWRKSSIDFIEVVSLLIVRLHHTSQTTTSDCCYCESVVGLILRY